MFGPLYAAWSWWVFGTGLGQDLAIREPIPYCVCSIQRHCNTGEAATAPCDVKASAELVVVVAVADGLPAKYLARPWLRSSGSVYGLSIDTGKLILVVIKEACVRHAPMMNKSAIPGLYRVKSPSPRHIPGELASRRQHPRRIFHQLERNVRKRRFVNSGRGQDGHRGERLGRRL